MKIAVPITSENHVNGHLGQSESYGIFTISDNKEITGMHTIPWMDGCGCRSDIASELAADGVTVLIAGGIGGGATNSFVRNGISVIRGWSGDATEVVKLYLAGEADDLGSSCHHDDAHGHHHHNDANEGHHHHHDAHEEHHHHHHHAEGNSCGDGCGCHSNV
jgi:predicted Fe-Mo cluster-binding NifX family protein